MRRILLFLLIVCATVSLNAQIKVGTSGATFLKIGLIPRSNGMGDAFVAVANDASSVFWNPAGLANLKGKGLFTSYTNWLLDTYTPALCYVMGIGAFGNLGIFTSGVQSGDFGEIRLEQNGEIIETGKTFAYTALQAGISYSRYFTDKFAAGVNVKFVYEGFGDYASAQTAALDAGTVFYTGFRSLRVAMALQNLGPDLRPSGEYDLFVLSGAEVVTEKRTYRAYKLPMVFRLGAAMELIENEDQVLTLALEGANPNDNDETFAIGTELRLRGILSFRAGYTFNKDEGGFGFGIGLNAQSIGLDYSFSDFGALPDIHRLGLNFSL